MYNANMKVRVVTGLKLLTLVCLIGLYFFMSVWDLKIDVINPDGINWHTRTQAFTKALKDGDYGQTYQVYHPGFTLMWLSGPVLNVFKPGFLDDASQTDPKSVFLDKDYYSKLSVVVFCGLIFVAILVVMCRLGGFSFAVAFGVLMALEPFIVGMRRLYHLDYLMTLPLFLAFLLFIYYNYKSPKIFLPVLAGLCFSLALLTKSTAIIFLPAIPFIVLLAEFSWKKKLVGIFTFLISTCLFLYLLFPPIWKNPIKSVPKYFEKIALGVSDIGVEGKKELGSSGKTDNITLDDTLEARDSNFYIASLFMRLSPPAGVLMVIGLGVYIYFFLKGLILLPVRAIKNKRFPTKFSFSSGAWLTFWSLAFAVVVMVALTLSVKKTDRYLILALPFLFTAVAYFFSRLKFYLWLPFMAFYLYFVYIELTIIHPYYFAYSNPYLGGLETRLRVLDEAPFGVATWASVDVVKKDLAENGNFGYYTVAGSKSVKAISSGGRFSRSPSCVTDYSIVFAFADKPTYACVQKYVLLNTIKIDGFDYWYIYKRLNQKHESNYD